MNNLMAGRLAAFRVIQGVVNEGRSLGELMPHYRSMTREREQALFYALSLGTLREYHALCQLGQGLMSRPLAAGSRSLALLVLGLYQLLRLNLGDHGVVNEMVKMTSQLQPSHRHLMNALLRRAQRERPALIAQLDGLAEKNLPAWLAAYPALAAINIRQPPFTLRLNPRLQREDFIAKYAGARANPLHPQAVSLEKSPNLADIAEFGQGLVSVQDASGQWVATLLNPRPGERLLDGCAAPGSKACHLLELAPDCDLLALDIDEKRLRRVAENLERLGQKAQLKAADLRRLNDWWDGRPFDAISVDAPCSGSGVIRRHPDIPFLRTAQDLANYPQVQREILTAAWRTLRPGGRLLYSTCSILPAENQQLIAAFLAAQSDCQLEPLPLPHCENGPHGSLHLPDGDGDGFFYALLHKSC